MGKMLYLNEKNEFYIMMDDSLYRINLGSMSVKKVVEGLSTGSYCASESNRYFAWVDSANQYSSNTIKVMDLKSGKTFEVKKGDEPVSTSAWLHKVRISYMDAMLLCGL